MQGLSLSPFSAQGLLWRMKVVMAASFKELSRAHKYCCRAPEDENVAPEPPHLTEEQRV